MSAAEDAVDHPVWSRAVPPPYNGPVPGADKRILAQLHEAVIDGQLDSRLVTALLDAERCSFKDIPTTSAWMATSGVELVVDLREPSVQSVVGASLVQVVELDEYIRHQLAATLRLRGAGGAELGSAVPAPYWPPRLSKPLYGLFGSERGVGVR